MLRSTLAPIFFFAVPLLDAPAVHVAPAQSSRLVKNDYDHIVLTSGKEVKGRVLFEDEDVVILRKGSRSDQEYPRADVAEIFSVERSLMKFLDMVDEAEDPDDMQAAAELGKFASENGLPGEARLAYLFMLTKDPENEVAWTALGGRQKPKGWEFKDGKRWRTLDDYREFHSEWKNALELNSTHFALKSDLPLEDSIRTLVTLEEFYREFYATMTPAIRLYPIDERPLINLTKDRKKYLVPPVPRDAWFDVRQNMLNVYSEGQVDVRLIVRYFTHGMIYNAFNNTLRRDGSVSPWVRTGLAEWFAGGTKDGEFRVEIDIDQPYTALFKRQAEAADPIPLKRLLSMSAMEMETGPLAELGAAEAYTLLYFLARGADRKYRDGLLEFVNSSYVGKGAATHFKKFVAKDLDALEEEWTAFVKEKARG